jgi:hypothetical protein
VIDEIPPVAAAGSMGAGAGESARGTTPAGAAEAAARAALRGQIARLDRELAVLVATTRLDAGPPLRDAGGPRLLDLGELERVRDGLAARLTVLHRRAAHHHARHAAARAELERMYADPPAHRWHRLTNADLGHPGCTSYHVRPRAGVLGMLMGWWEVKVSGGCPLP